MEYILATNVLSLIISSLKFHINQTKGLGINYVLSSFMKTIKSFFLN